MYNGLHSQTRNVEATAACFESRAKSYGDDRVPASNFPRTDSTRQPRDRRQQARASSDGVGLRAVAAGQASPLFSLLGGAKTGNRVRSFHPIVSWNTVRRSFLVRRRSFWINFTQSSTSSSGSMIARSHTRRSNENRAKLPFLMREISVRQIPVAASNATAVCHFNLTEVTICLATTFLASSTSEFHRS